MVAIKLITVSALLALVSAAPSIKQRDPIADKRTDSNSYGSSYGSSNSDSYGGSSDNSNSYGSSNSNSYGSSNSNSQYGSSNSDSYGNSNSNSYGGSNNNNYGSGTTTTSSKMMMETSMAMMTETTTSSMMMETTTSSMMMETTTTAAEQSMSTPSYGSGSNNWGNNGYNNCVQQCMMQYAPPPSMYTPPSSMSGGYGGSSGGSGGQTWTVTVAPIKGVLRFVPFAVNASVGDTVRFVWANGPHSVTSSSILEPCNATSFFDSQLQNSSFTFDQPVKDDNPQFFYCKVPNHCAKGMFGIINAPNNGADASTVQNMLPLMAANNSDLAAQMMYTQKLASVVPGAWEWGGSISMAGMSPENQMNMVQNTLMTRLVMASNPTQLTKNVLTPTGPLTVPDDISNIKAADGAPSGASAPAPAASGGAPAVSSNQATGPANNAASSPAASASPKPNAAPRSVATSTGTVVFAVLAAAFFAL